MLVTADTTHTAACTMVRSPCQPTQCMSNMIIICTNLTVTCLQAWKPPRTHHDSMSGTCVLKMDHYCIWVLNCVGLLNYKAFLLFLVYTFLATFLATAALVNGFVIYFKELQEEDPQPSAK